MSEIGVGTKMEADWTVIEIHNLREGEIGPEVQVRYVHVVPHVQSNEWYPLQWLIETGWRVKS